MSAVRRSGASRAAKWPPRPNSDHWVTLFNLSAKGFDFEVLDPPELVPVLKALAERLGKAAGAP